MHRFTFGTPSIILSPEGKELAGAGHSLIKISNEVAPPFPRFVREEPALSEIEGWASTNAEIISARSRLRAIHEHSIVWRARPRACLATEQSAGCSRKSSSNCILLNIYLFLAFGIWRAGAPAPLNPT